MNIAAFFDLDSAVGQAFTMRDAVACSLPIILLAASVISLL